MAGMWMLCIAIVTICFEAAGVRSMPWWIDACGSSRVDLIRVCQFNSERPWNVHLSLTSSVRPSYHIYLAPTASALHPWHPPTSMR